MKYKTIEQANAVVDITSSHIIIQEEGVFDDTKYDVELLCEMQDKAGSEIYYRLYTVHDNGDTNFADYKPVKEYGDESFDVVVEKEIEKEKKTMAKFDIYEVAHEAFAEMFEDYVREHQDELVSYAQAVACDKVCDYIRNNLDLEDGAHDIIDSCVDYHLEYDFEPDYEIQESIINQYIFE